jgi:hypothetical protein
MSCSGRLSAMLDDIRQAKAKLALNTKWVVSSPFGITRQILLLLQGWFVRPMSNVLNLWKTMSNPGFEPGTLVFQVGNATNWAMKVDIHQQQIIFNFSIWNSFYVNELHLQQLIFDPVRRCSSKRDEYHLLWLITWDDNQPLGMIIGQHRWFIVCFRWIF